MKRESSLGRSRRTRVPTRPVGQTLDSCVASRRFGADTVGYRLHEMNRNRSRPSRRRAHESATRARDRLALEWVLIPLGVVSAIGVVFGLRSFL